MDKSRIGGIFKVEFNKLVGKGLFLSLVLSLLFCFSFFSNVAKAEVGKPDNELHEIESKLRSNFLNLGIDSLTSEKLIQKVLKGELLDSQKPELVNSKLEEVELSPENPTEIIEFEDGSRVELTIKDEPNEELITPLGAATGTVGASCKSSGSYAKSCTLSPRYRDGVWDIRFKAKAEIVRGGNDMIHSIYGNYVDAVGYSVEHMSFKITRKKESGSNRAKAVYKNRFNGPFGSYTVVRDLALYVGKDTYYARLEW